MEWIEREYTRGDTIPIKLKFKRKNGDVFQEKFEKMYFTIKENNNQTEPVIQKSISQNTIKFSEDDYYYRLIIEPEETDNLVFDTKYYFDVEIIHKGKVSTPIKGTIKFSEETTHKANEV